MFDGFVNAIIKNTPIPCDALAGYRTTMLSELAMRSIELNQPLPVPAEKWDYYVHVQDV